MTTAVQNPIDYVWASPEQLDDLWQMEQSMGTTWPHPRSYFEECIRYGRVLLANCGGQDGAHGGQAETVGYLVYEVIWGNTAFLSLLKIHPRFQQRGIGKKLVSLLEKRLTECGYKSYVTSTELINPYTKNFFPSLGFSHIGELSMQHGVEVFYLKRLAD